MYPRVSKRCVEEQVLFRTEDVGLWQLKLFLIPSGPPRSNKPYSFDSFGIRSHRAGTDSSLAWSRVDNIHAPILIIDSS